MFPRILVYKLCVILQLKYKLYILEHIQNPFWSVPVCFVPYRPSANIIVGVPLESHIFIIKKKFGRHHSCDLCSFLGTYLNLGNIDNMCADELLGHS